MTSQLSWGPGAAASGRIISIYGKMQQIRRDPFSTRISGSIRGDYFIRMSLIALEAQIRVKT